MLILPGQGVIVVATPRTGSRAMNAAIIKAATEAGQKVTKTKLHHDFPHEVRKAIGEKYQVWTIIREPISQLKSWLSHSGCWCKTDEFIEEYHSRYFMYEGGMNIYNQVVDRYFIYEQGGIYKMLEALGFKRDGTVEVIGATGSEKHTLTEAQIEKARHRFIQDFELYEMVLNKVGVIQP